MGKKYVNDVNDKKSINCPTLTLSKSKHGITSTRSMGLGGTNNSLEQDNISDFLLAIARDYTPATDSKTPRHSSLVPKTRASTSFQLVPPLTTDLYNCETTFSSGSTSLDVADPVNSLLLKYAPQQSGVNIETDMGKGRTSRKQAVGHVESEDSNVTESHGEKFDLFCAASVDCGNDNACGNSENDSGTSILQGLNVDSIHDENYKEVLEPPQTCMDLLHQLFSNDKDGFYDFNVDFDKDCKFEWLPQEPNASVSCQIDGNEIEDLFNSVTMDCDESQEGLVISLEGNCNQSDLESKLEAISFVHESLNANAEAASLCNLEKFLVELLQPNSSLGSLSRFGRLIAFVNLTFIQKHISQLDALYKHPEMLAIRNVISENDMGSIWNIIQHAAGYQDPQPDNTNTHAIMKLINRISRSESPIQASGQNVESSQSASANLGGHNAHSGKYKTYTSSASTKLQRQLLKVLDCISGVYASGKEPHFPRFVCGVVDRKNVQATETFSVPFKKSDKRNIHVQMEKLSGSQRHWPDVTLIPHTLTEGMHVQVAPPKALSHMYWKEGVVTLISAGVVTVTMNSEQERERTFLFRNFLAPNVPVIKIERGCWRLLPRPLDLETDLYVGACLCLDEGNGDCVDVVIMNVYFENGCVAPVKSPGDESLFHYVTNNDKTDILNVTCSCNGRSLRVFEGGVARVYNKPVRVLVHYFHENKQRLVDVEGLSGFKLNYDLQAHYDLVSENFLNTQLPFCVWVVPRDLSFLKGVDMGKVDTVARRWMLEPQKCLVLFPFNRNVDLYQDISQLVCFLHPEMNFAALGAGMWTVRTSDKSGANTLASSFVNSMVSSMLSGGLGTVSESNSCTRSQKAAIRDIVNDATGEGCSGIVVSPFPLLRRLYGCTPVISLWIAMEAVDPQVFQVPTDMNVEIPALPPCSKCKGVVFSRRDITRLVPYKEGESPRVPIFANLEKTGDLVRRLQHVAGGRWRITRDFAASYTVDDDFVITSTRLPSAVVEPEESEDEQDEFATFDGPNLLFLRHLHDLMSNVKMAMDNAPLEPVLYRNACDNASQDLTTQMEIALAKGWESFIRQEQIKGPPPLVLQDTNLLPIPLAQMERSSQDTNNTATEFTKLLNTQDISKLIKPSMPLVSGDSKSLLAPDPSNLELLAAFNRTQEAKKQALQLDLNAEYLKALGGSCVASNQQANSTVSSSTDNCKAPRSRNLKRGLKDGDSKASKSSKSRHLKAEADADFCKFSDKPNRLMFLACVKWDENLEQETPKT
ncbi:hypothetical protein BdWA1_000396 [Babesia duncani]|uniref:Uncharacterized protein n=1 Tax=Babesia duncani TaxID=323732 RepID=A0AAD9UPV8_9APIC|nr:hypothetical protein BdWA1_000396 [Babesia duncani]